MEITVPGIENIKDQPIFTHSQSISFVFVKRGECVGQNIDPIQSTLI